MLQHQAPSPRKSRRAGGESAPGSVPDQQSRLGNAAIAERTSANGSSGALADEEISSWMGEEQVGREPPHRGPNDGPHGPTRPTSVRGGMKGALIGKTDEIVLRDGPSAEGAEVGTVPDGVPCEVVSARDGWIEVKVRSGSAMVEGWVEQGLFSDQPSLTQDDANKELPDDYVFSKLKGDHTPVDPKGTDTAQGAIGDCYLIASMAAIANASPQTIKDAIKYNAEKDTYTVRFYEEQGWGKYEPVYVEVDAYVPTSASNRADPVYAGDESGEQWPAILEKAYAKWKGGYDAIGNGGYGAETMAEITGARSSSVSPSSMSEDEVIPYFEKAKKDGKAIYAAIEHSRKSDVQTPFKGNGDGPYSATLKQTHRWNHVVPGTLKITDKEGTAGSAYDTGKEGDATAAVRGSKVKDGSVDYKSHAVEVAYKDKSGPAKAEDLEVRFDYQGVVNTDKLLVANHAYAFEGVTSDGKELQFYNPWGTWQPKPVTPAEFLKHFSNVSVNQAPAGATKA